MTRSFVFGVEDSVVSTVGMVSGVAAVGTGRSLILISGFILIFVEAFSMAVGNLVSDNTVEEIRARAEEPLMKSLAPAVVMFVSYLVSGFIVLLPYAFFEPMSAMSFSISASLIMLFLLGAVGASFARISLIKNGLKMASVGGAAILIGIGAGYGIQMLTIAGIL